MSGDRGRLPLVLHLDCGDDALPGHRFVVRGLSDERRSADSLSGTVPPGRAACQMVSLLYELVPGVSSAEAADAGGSLTVDATYAPDVPLAWSTGGIGPEGLPGPGGAELAVGGSRTSGESGPWPVPPGARRLTFWIHSAVAVGVVGTVVVDLDAGSAAWEPWERLGEA